MKPRKTKSPAGSSGTGTPKDSKQPRQSTGKSTHSEAQRERILNALRRRPQTSYDLRCLGCYQSACRVKELRDRFGYVITTARITLVDRDGYSHPRAALYTLVAEPNGQQPQ